MLALLLCVLTAVTACSGGGTDPGSNQETVQRADERDDGRVLGTHAVTLWERDEPYDALDEARRADDVRRYFVNAFDLACASDDPEPSWAAAGLASIVASMYSSVPSDDPTAQDFIDEHGFAVDEAMRKRTLDVVDCVQRNLASEDIFGEYLVDFVSELKVLTNLLTGPPA